MDWLAVASVVVSIVVPVLYGIYKLVQANDDLSS